MRNLSPMTLLLVAIGCAVIGLVALSAIGGETGTAANIGFAVQIAVLVLGAVALVMSLVGFRRARRDI